MVLQLEFFEYVQGAFSFIYIIISFSVSIIILSRYFKIKNRKFILVGLGFLTMVFPWSGDALNFVLIWFDTTLPWDIYFIIGNVPIPILLIFWIIAIIDFLDIENKKRIMIPYLILVGVFEIIFFVLLLTGNQHIIGIPHSTSPFIVYWGDFIGIFLLLFIIIALITGILFARESMKSESAEIRMKGIFILAAFISFTIAALFDSQLATLSLPMDITVIFIVLVRVILMTSALEFYIGMIMPSWVKKLLIKE